MSTVNELIGLITTQYEFVERAQALRTALQSQSHRPFKPRTLNLRSTHDNFLRGSLLGLDRAQHLQFADQSALRYWRYGHDRSKNEVDAQREDYTYGTRSASFYRSRLGTVPVSSGFETFEPGMGLETECFASFLTRSDKERAVRNYILSGTTESLPAARQETLINSGWLGNLVQQAQTADSSLAELKTAIWTEPASEAA